jgi:hypothetical protein
MCLAPILWMGKINCLNGFSLPIGKNGLAKSSWQVKLGMMVAVYRNLVYMFHSQKMNNLC